MKKYIKDLLNQEIYVEHFDGCPIFTEMTGAGFTRGLSKTGLFPYALTFAHYKDREGDWMTLVSDQKKVGINVIKKYLADKNSMERLYKDWLKKFNLMVKRFYGWMEEDLTRFNDKELWRWANDIYVFCRDEVSMAGFIDGYMFYADKRFDQILKEFCEENKIAGYPKIYSALGAPIEGSFISEEEEELNKIIESAINTKGLTNQEIIKNLKDSEKFQSAIKKHLKKYSWIKSGYTGHKEYTISDVYEEVKRYKRKSKKEMGEALLADNKKLKNQLIKKYKFTPEIIAIAKITERLGKWQDQRKMYTLLYVTVQEKILKEISKRKKIDLELLRYGFLEDIKKILTGKFNIKQLEEKRNGCLVIHKKGKLADVLVGKEAEEFVKEATKVDVAEMSEIKGMTASVGKVTGRVVVLASVKQLDKVKEGDIIVSPMTRPEHLAGMKKAAAIVTDDGGITCHAAIVARELKKPCIIGTRIATKVLKDGDIVEVDADNGVVRIMGVKK